MSMPWNWGRSRAVVFVLLLAFTVAGVVRDMRDEWRRKRGR